MPKAFTTVSWSLRMTSYIFIIFLFNLGCSTFGLRYTIASCHLSLSSVLSIVLSLLDQAILTAPLPLSVWVPAAFMPGLVSTLIDTPVHQNEEYFEEYKSDFITAQFESTRNAVTTNTFSEMQYQLEHHYYLFPTVPRSKYLALCPIPMKFAENNIPGG